MWHAFPKNTHEKRHTCVTFCVTLTSPQVLNAIECRFLLTCRWRPWDLRWGTLGTFARRGRFNPSLPRCCCRPTASKGHSRSSSCMRTPSKADACWPYWTTWWAIDPGCRGQRQVEPNDVECVWGQHGHEQQCRGISQKHMAPFTNMV